MSKIISTTELATIVTKLLTNLGLNVQPAEFQKFFTNIAQAVCTYQGGEIQTLPVIEDNTWYIGIQGDAKLRAAAGGIWRKFDPEGELFPRNVQNHERNIFMEALTAKTIWSSDPLFAGEHQKICLNLHGVAQHILHQYPKNTIIDSEIYDSNPVFSSSLIAMNGTFEYPNWSGRPLGEFLKHFGFSEEQLSHLNLLQYTTTRINSSGTKLAFVSSDDFLGSTPSRGDTWLLPNGHELLLI